MFVRAKTKQNKKNTTEEIENKKYINGLAKHV